MENTRLMQMFTDKNKKYQGIKRSVVVIISFVILLTSLFVFSSGIAYADDEVQVTLGNEGEISPHNPYSKNCTINVQIGHEFATYDIDNISEGYIYKLAGLETDIALPKLRAKDGYIFVGWSQGGFEEPTWDALTDVVSIQSSEEPPTVSRTATIYALFADEEGNGYCTCGAYSEGRYTDDLESYKAIYEQYLKKNYSLNPFITISVVAAMALIFIGILLRVRFEESKNRQDALTDVKTQDQGNNND